MDSLSVEVVRYLLDFVSDPRDLVIVHRLSTTYAKAVDSEYWHRRVCRQLDIPFLFDATVRWNQVYRELYTSGNPLRVMMEYKVSKLAILEWMEINTPVIELSWLTKYHRYDLVEDFARLYDPEFYAKMDDSVKPLPSKSLSKLVVLFQGLLGDPLCPMDVICRFNDKYQFIQRAESALITHGNPYEVGRLFLFAEAPLLSAEQSLSRVIYVLSLLPVLSFESNQAELTLIVVEYTDSSLVFSLLLEPCSAETQMYVKEQLYSRRTSLDTELSQLIIGGMTLQQVQEDITAFLSTSPPLDHESYYGQLFHHPSVDREFLITRIMPHIYPQIRDLIAIQGQDDKTPLAYWKEWNITDVDIFLDPRTISFIDPFFDTFQLLTKVSYSSDPASKYFTFLSRLPDCVTCGQTKVLRDYIVRQPELMTDKVLWRNLLIAGKSSLVTAILEHAIDIK
jgi:hypothetical protein